MQMSKRRRVGRLPGGGRLYIDGAHPVEEISPRAGTHDGDVAAQIVGGEGGGRQLRRTDMDVEAPA